MELGVLSLLPIIVLFILIFTTKRMLLSLTAASLVGSFLLGESKASPQPGLKRFRRLSWPEPWVICSCFWRCSGFSSHCWISSGAVTEFATWLSKYANTRKKALLITYLLGWLIFVDDYLNNMAIATAMKKLRTVTESPVHYWDM